MKRIPAHVTQFRETYRREHAPRYYSGELHLAFAAFVLIGTMGWHLLRVTDLSWAELMVVPATVLLGNWVEYAMHRYTLHGLHPLLKPLYHIHSVDHHRYYTYEAMDLERFRDFMQVLFPPWAHVLVPAALSIIGMWIVAPMWSTNAGHLFAASGTSGLLLYEVLHSLSHCADDSWAGRLPLIQGIRRHHRLHHHPSLMNRWNFNISLPVFDLVLGTRTMSAPAAAPAREPGRQVDRKS